MTAGRGSRTRSGGTRTADAGPAPAALKMSPSDDRLDRAVAGQTSREEGEQRDGMLV
jgi:hypothetical protein